MRWYVALTYNAGMVQVRSNNKYEALKFLEDNDYQVYYIETLNKYLILNKIDSTDYYTFNELYKKGEIKVKKKPLFVATMYNDYFFIMYTDKKAIEKDDKDRKDKE